ncbi:MAG: hypothetical protein ACRD25_12135 [Terracidiphilus sp.]
MLRFIVPLALLVAAALFGGAYFWATHPPIYAVSIVQLIDHHFVVAAYTAAWVIQLSYVTSIALRWRNQKRVAEGMGRGSR